jgi:hypothetical protein
MLVKTSLVALAAVIAAGAFDAALAAKKKGRAADRPPASEYEQRKRGFDHDLNIRTDANGVPIIMRGFDSSQGRRTATAPEAEPRLRPDRPRPRGSGTYIPSPVPSPNAGPSPQEILGRQTVQPYKPPPINTFGDRVTNCIHSFPLNAGIGNNPRDQQSYIRQCAN